MPVLLLIPLLILAVVALWALLLPVSLWARYRTGRARRRAQAWAVRANAWLLAASLALFLLSAWMAGAWVAQALRDAALGALAGGALGIVGVWLTRFEYDAAGAMFYTPNRWLVLGLTGLVAARLGAGLWYAWHDAVPAQEWLHAGSLFGVGGVLVGYGLGYTWGLRARLPRRPQLAPR